MTVEILSDENLDVLAEDILAGDDDLSVEAGRKMLMKLKQMRNPLQREKFLKRFAPHNRKRLIKAMRTAKMMPKNTGNNSRLLQKKAMYKIAMNDESYVWNDSSNYMNDTSSWSDAGNNVIDIIPINNEVLANEDYLAGKFRERRAKKIAEKAAKAKPGSLKQKRLEAKAIKKTAKATGDKELLKKGKELRRGVAKERAKKAGKFIAKVNPVLAAGRGAFIGMVALNLRGLATKMAKAKEMGKFAEIAKKWEALGGKAEKLEKAINRGKDKKALLGKGKGLNGYEYVDIYEQLNDEILAAQTEYLGLEPGTTAGVTAAAAAPVLIAIVPILKKLFPGDKSLEETEEGVTSEEGKTKGRKFLDRAKNFFSGKGGKASQTIGKVLGAAGAAGTSLIEDKIEEITTGEKVSKEVEEEEGSSKMNLLLPLGIGGALLAFFALGKKKNKN
jgi:hypothetical protein